MTSFQDPLGRSLNLQEFPYVSFNKIPSPQALCTDINSPVGMALKNVYVGRIDS